MKKHNKIFFWIVIAVVTIGMISRLFGLPSNVNPMLAVLLFGAAYFQRKSLSILLPLGLFFVVDLYLNNVVYARFFDGFQIFGDKGVYASFMVIIPLAIIALKKVSIPRVILSSLGIAVLFFLITNFVSMLTSPMYTKDFAGLMESYSAGIPFFRATIVSTLVYSGVLFTAAELFLRQPSLDQTDTKTKTIKA